MSDKAALREVASEKIGREEMLHRARAFIPILRERTMRTENLRRLPKATFDDFRRAEIFRTAQPEPHGGLGLDVDTIDDVTFELARGDPSAAWVARFLRASQPYRRLL